MVLALHCSRTVAACSHVLQALTALPARMSCRLMMALTSGALEMCACWEHAFLAAQAGLLGFSLCLRLAAHRELWDT
jgi:hypothetical protein